ncbi:hypothetical protein FRB97_003462 [Tulasnella sp. 331]|nr:hypothetical protein FRB97_003462 [Tulasnella sp. 331]
MQVSVFHIHGICSPKIFEIQKAAGFLGALIWYSAIDDMDMYLKDLQILIDNLLDRFADYDPNKLLTKAKFHILTHLPSNIRRFGPAVRYATEIFECFNAVFRLCSIFSNRAAASRDIAFQLADLDRFKHISSGGFWSEGLSSDTQLQASHGVRSYVKANPRIQQLLGWSPVKSPEPGTVKCLIKTKAVKWEDTITAKRIKPLPAPGANVITGTWKIARHVVSDHHDIGKPGSFMVFKTGKDNPAEIGRIIEILVPGNIDMGITPIVTIDTFEVGDLLHTSLEMPVLTRSGTICISPAHLSFLINVQHDCIGQGCDATGSQTIMQERVASGRTRRDIVHQQEDDHFIINLHALHNAAKIRKVLPRKLTEPRPWLSDRKATHAVMAGIVRSTQGPKRVEIQRKKAEATAKAGAKKKSESKKAPTATSLEVAPVAEAPDQPAILTQGAINREDTEMQQDFEEEDGNDSVMDE